MAFNPRWLPVLLLVLLSACGGGGSAVLNPWPGHENAGVYLDYAKATAALDRFNHYRRISGVPAVELSYELSLGCQQHANYLQQNGISLFEVGLGAHQEDPQLPGYSFLGSQAGLSSVIYQGVAPVEAVDNWMRTLYHRLGMLAPNLLSIGFGSAGEYQVMNVISGRGGLSGRHVVLYPPAGSYDLPRDYKTEIPHPIEGDPSLGIPITAEFFGLGTVITDVETTLTNLETGSEIDCYLQWPGHAYLPSMPASRHIALIPVNPLPPLTPCYVQLEARVDGQSWSTGWDFQTRP